jgi:thiamine biosynthesis protein ThiS
VTGMKVIFLNGRETETKAGDVAALVAELGLAVRAVLVEHNGVALRAEEWARPIAGGDRVEILRVVAGG